MDLTIGTDKKMVSTLELRDFEQAHPHKQQQHHIIWLQELPELIKEVLKEDQKVLSMAEQLYEKKSLLIMGRGYNFATCLEGALKVKELTYMHSEGIHLIIQVENHITDA